MNNMTERQRTITAKRAAKKGKNEPIAIRCKGPWAILSQKNKANTNCRLKILPIPHANNACDFVTETVLKISCQISLC